MRIAPRFHRPVLCTLAWLLACAHLQAKTFIVTSFSDGYGPNTLRGAIIAANRSGGNNTIILSSGTYRLTLPGNSEDKSMSGDLDVYGKLTITTQRGLPATIDARNLGDRVFQIQTNARVTLENLTIAGGSTPSYVLTGNGLDGGGILNFGTLTLNKCTVAGNKVGNVELFYSGPLNGGDGGGIFNAARLILNNCSISNNSAGPGGVGFTFIGSFPGPGGQGGFGGLGGGIYNVGTLAITGSVITGNQAGKGGIGGLGSGTGGNGGVGGGIYNSSLTSTKITTCIISNNIAGAGGDGQVSGFNDGPPISGGNGGVGGNGGGVFNQNGSVAPTLSHSLVAFNSPGPGGAGGAGSIGGGSNPDGPAGNTGADGTSPDLSGQFATKGHNLIRIGDGSTGLVNGVNNDTVGTSGQPANPGP